MREELQNFKDEHGIKLRYIQPQHTTSFMNRKSSAKIDPKDYQSINKNRLAKKAKEYERSSVGCNRPVTTGGERESTDLAVNNDLSEMR